MFPHLCLTGVTLGCAVQIKPLWHDNKVERSVAVQKEEPDDRQSRGLGVSPRH